MADSTPFQIADLPVGLKEPGVYVTIRIDGDVGLSEPNNRCLIWGYMSAGGSGVPNSPFRALSQDDVDANFQSYSMISHAYAAAKAQIPIGAEVWLMPLLEPAGGTAQAVTITITGEPTAGVLSTATAALAADTMTIRYRGRGVQVGIKAGDTWATIATAAKAAWDALLNAPATCGLSTATLTLTARHKGNFDDGAVEVTFDSKGVSGVAASFGSATFAGVASVASAGSVVTTVANRVVTTTITDTETAVASGTALVNSFLTDSYAIRVAQPASPTGAVTLFYVNGHPVRPLTVTSVLSGVTTQTLTVVNGTAGAGNPTLTSALNNLAQLEDYFRAWSVFYTTIAELSAMATSVEAQDAVPIMKGQIVSFGLTNSLTAMSAANIPAVTTPRLDSSARYTPLWATQAPNAGWELASRLAAAEAAEPFVARNWNGFEFIGTTSAPLVAIHPLDRPSRDDRNAAIGLRHAPVTVNSKGNMSLVWGGNCYKAKGFKDAKLVKISARMTLDYYRTDLINYLGSLFAGKKIKTQSAPRTGNSTDINAVKTAVYRWTKRLDDADLFDGAEANRDAIKAAIVVSPTRIDVNVPFVPPADLDIIAPVGIQS
jgi:phage tail sheath gpL-like